MKLLILVLGLTFSVVSFAAKDKKRMPASPSPEPTEISEKMDAKLKALSIHRYDCSADLTISSSSGLGSFDTKDSQTVFARSEADAVLKVFETFLYNREHTRKFTVNDVSCVK